MLVSGGRGDVEVFGVNFFSFLPRLKSLIFILLDVLVVSY